MFTVSESWMESCAICRQFDSAKKDLRGIRMEDARKHRDESSYIDICSACLPKFKKMLAKAESEVPTRSE